MKALKTIAATILAAALLAAGFAAETLALANFTLLNPGFYGATERSAYELIGRIVVEKMADAVLERAPAIALRTTDKQQAYALAMKALPPAKVADMLEESAPDIERFLFIGGDIPVMKDSSVFAVSEVSVVKSLLMDGLWDMLPQKPSFPAFMPFTPEWNIGYGASLSKSLWLPRWYAGMAGQAIWLSLSAIVLLAGLLYLLWIRERKPFFTVTGTLFVINSLLLFALAASVAYSNRSLAQTAAAIAPLTSAADLFGGDFPELFRTVLWPFRQIFFVSATVSASFGITMFAMGISTGAGLETGERPLKLGRSRPRHRKTE